MSDLIRRKDVIKLVNQFVFGVRKEQIYEAKKTFIKYIEKMPTAYDISRVVEELDCDRCESCSFLEVCAGSKCCTECHKKIIEIVRQGGVYDDVCAWRLCDEEANVYDTSCRNPHILIEGTPKENNYEYCPYCGKKIKEMESD